MARQRRETPLANQGDRQHDVHLPERSSLNRMIGGHYLGNAKTHFRVWAPNADRLEVHLLGENDRYVPLERSYDGYWSAVVQEVTPGQLYLYRINGSPELPDPASRYQVDTVHGPSQVIDSCFQWTDDRWFGIPLANYVLYELHVGTFTAEGTFDAIIPHLQVLKDLGVTAIELMPVSQFPGQRNWGYDLVYPYAVQNSYGGPEGLKRLVDAAHNMELAVVLDVVYNHLGPEGNYLAEFGPYFTDKYKTPWGPAINYDDQFSDEVRHYFIGSACYWVEDFHIDGLRLDATHFIMDTSAVHFLQELAVQVHAAGERLNRRVHLFAESDANDVRWVRSADIGGFGMNAQWNDDFQHALLTVLPGADARAYENDYGEFWQLTKAYEEGFVYSGQYSEFRKRRHGNSSREVHGKRLVVFMQNHDQVGNKPNGSRLCAQVGAEGQKLAAAAYILSPCLPLLFMGEEYAETAPFFYFVSHGDENLIKLVREGRKQEFAHFLYEAEPPDPHDEETFLQSKLNLELRHHGHHKMIWDYYRHLLQLRRSVAPLQSLDRNRMKVREYEHERVLLLEREMGEESVITAFNFCETDVALPLPFSSGNWTRLLDSSDTCWNGPGTTTEAFLSGTGKPIRITLRAQSAVVYYRPELHCDNQNLADK